MMKYNITIKVFVLMIASTLNINENKSINDQLKIRRVTHIKKGELKYITKLNFRFFQYYTYAIFLQMKSSFQIILHFR